MLNQAVNHVLESCYNKIRCLIKQQIMTNFKLYLLANSYCTTITLWHNQQLKMERIYLYSKLCLGKTRTDYFTCQSWTTSIPVPNNTIAFIIAFPPLNDIVQRSLIACEDEKATKKTPNYVLYSCWKQLLNMVLSIKNPTKN